MRGTQDLYWILDHELKAASRYRRSLSLTLIALGEQNQPPHETMLECFRDSDEVFDLEGVAAVLMEETDTAAALAAIERVKRMAGESRPMHFAVGSYPRDASKRSRELVARVMRRLEAACRAEDGSIVCYD